MSKHFLGTPTASKGLTLALQVCSFLWFVLVVDAHAFAVFCSLWLPLSLCCSFLFCVFVVAAIVRLLRSFVRRSSWHSFVSLKIHFVYCTMCFRNVQCCVCAELVGVEVGNQESSSLRHRGSKSRKVEKSKSRKVEKSKSRKVEKSKK